MNPNNQLEELEAKLAALDAERQRLLSEIKTIKTTQNSTQLATDLPPLLGTPALGSTPVSSEEKISLFLRLFRCRESIFPKRWENKKNGKQGYSPVCGNEWVKPICRKPEIKCADCKHQRFPSLNEQAVESHLKGLSTIGTYAIREDDSCVFLASDFDETGWQDDALAYKQTAREFGIEVAIERSRSGNGAHAWIFFQQPIPARMARSIGTLILARCSESNVRLSLDSYDRFFPAQDSLPRGGFGNLIALPLQKAPRQVGNSCFLADDLSPIQDQWRYLSQVRMLSLTDVREVLDRWLPKVKPPSKTDAFDDIAWITDKAILETNVPAASDRHLLDGTTVEVTFGPMLSIPLEGLPGKVVSKLKKTASFPNPEFYKRQRMRRPTYPEPRFIFSGEMRSDEIVLPRGVLDAVTGILTLAGAKIVIRDERVARRKIKVEFHGKLTDIQRAAVKACKASDIGILSAPPGSGKTVMACALISERKVSTLVLVNRKQIFDQWKEKISFFLGVPSKEIGILNGSGKKITGRIDLGMMQALTRIEDLNEMSQRYSQIIIDECHHIPAESFEAILKQIPARYVLGLTATPYRKDGLEKLLFHQCGPIRHEIESADGGVLAKSVTIYETGFRLPEDIGRMPPYHVLIHSLTKDPSRNKLIAKETVSSITKGEFPLLISDRKEHLDTLGQNIKEEFEITYPWKALEIIRLDGGLSNKQRQSAIDQLKEFRQKQRPVVLMSTTSLIGEGFDLPELDTLVLATPLSFEGRMIQYAGRIHRLVEGKTKVQIIDFVDSWSTILLKMYRNRLKAYKKMGYTTDEPLNLLGPRKANSLMAYPSSDGGRA